MFSLLFSIADGGKKMKKPVTVEEKLLRRKTNEDNT